MKKSVSRRSFLGDLSMATAGLAMLSTPSFVNAFSESGNLKGYNPYASTNADLRQTLFGKHITVTGTIYKQDGVTVLPDATIEVWHLSPYSKKYRHRTKIRSDAQGHYTFITDMPNKELGKMPCINFKFSHADKSYYSRLWIHQHGAFISSDHWERNQQLGDMVLPTKEALAGHEKFNFNLSI